MKKLLVLASITLSALVSFAESKPKYLLRDEYLSNGEIYQSFNLRASDGSVKTFHPNAVHDDGILQKLPAEQGADYTLCKKDLDINLYLKLTEITIRLSDFVVNGSRGTLTQDEVALIKKTPRCNEYKQSLVSIASMLYIDYSGDAEELKKMSVVKINDVHYIELKTDKEATAYLRISSGLPKKVKKIADLSGIVVLAENSGQNLSLQIRFADYHFDQTPTRDHRTEACTITREERICDDKGSCQTRTITESGIRYISSQTKFDSETYELKLTDAQGREVFKGQLTDGDFNSRDTHTGPCMRR